MKKLAAVLFDLDGTLIDTAPDMAAALNKLLTQHSQTTLPFEQLRDVVSKGSIALVKQGFGSDIDDAQLQILQQQFLTLYSEAVCVNSVLFAGMDALLNQLERATIPWGIVTNKPRWLAEPLLQQLQLWQRLACIVCGDDLARRKPHPDPLLEACKQINCDPGQALYVGDDQRDIDAGRAAGLPTLVALYGYIGAQESPQLWGADAMINSVDELQRWLDQRIQT